MIVGEIGLKRTVRELFGKHNGQSIAVLGGAETLPDDLYFLPNDCILMSCNQHAYEAGLEPNYFVFLKTSEAILKWYRSDANAIVVSLSTQHTDYLVDVDYYHRGFTGHFATWLASELTDSDIILCGMDLYSGSKPYFHDQKHSDFIKGAIPFERNKRMWEQMKSKIKNTDRVYVMSGPLTEIFKPYD